MKFATGDLLLRRFEDRRQTQWTRAATRSSDNIVLTLGMPPPTMHNKPAANPEQTAGRAHDCFESRQISGQPVWHARCNMRSSQETANPQRETLGIARNKDRPRNCAYRALRQRATRWAFHDIPRSRACQPCNNPAHGPRLPHACDGTHHSFIPTCHNSDARNLRIP